MSLMKILVEQLTAYQRGDRWEYQFLDPVLHFQSETDPERSLYWVLSWMETEDGDDHLLIKETKTVETLACFEQVEWLDQTLIISSSIHLENEYVTF